jgi:hypothetical protein
MTDQADLERAYRRLLGWYPRAFRQEKGPEILAVLMAGARDGQRRPGLAESGDLIRSGLRMRLRPSVPRSARTVRAAVWLMCAGAAWPAVNLVVLLTVLLADSGAAMAALRKVNPGLTAAQVSQQYTSDITIGIVGGVVVIALWLWMAWANGQGRDWARIVATVLFGLVTLDLFALGGPGIVSSLGVSGLIFPVLNWLIGLAAAGLLWLPASTAFFRSPGFAEARHQAQTGELARIRSSRPRMPRQV